MKKNIVKALSALVAISLLTFAGCKQGVAQDEVDALKSKVEKFERMAEYQGLRSTKGARTLLTTALTDFKKGGSDDYIAKKYKEWTTLADTADDMDKDSSKELVSTGTAAQGKPGYDKLSAVEKCFTDLKKDYDKAVNGGYGIRLVYKEADGTVSAVLDTEKAFDTLPVTAKEVIGADSVTDKTVRKYVEDKKGTDPATVAYAEKLQSYLEAIVAAIEKAEAAIKDRQEVHTAIKNAGLTDKVGGLHRSISNEKEQTAAVDAATAAVKAAEARLAVLAKEFN